MLEYIIKDNLGREYLVEAEEIPTSRDARMFLHKIKDPNDKCFTLKYILSRSFLNTEQAPKPIEDYLFKKTKGIIVEGEITKDYIIEITTQTIKEYPPPPKVRFKKHSSCE